MFSPTASNGSVQRSWRESVLRAVDLIVAFATLESYQLPRTRPHDPIDTTTGRASRSAATARHIPAHGTPALRPQRIRRPGEARHREHHCVTPLRSEASRRHSTHQHAR